MIFSVDCHVSGGNRKSWVVENIHIRLTRTLVPTSLLYYTQVEDGHTAEVVTTLKGTTFRVAESSPDMYASIDLVSNRLVSTLNAKLVRLCQDIISSLLTSETFLSSD